MWLGGVDTVADRSTRVGLAIILVHLHEHGIGASKTIPTCKATFQ